MTERPMRREVVLVPDVEVRYKAVALANGHDQAAMTLHATDRDEAIRHAAMWQREGFRASVWAVTEDYTLQIWPEERT